jgi:5-methylcytosine-specific restriction endonuclease McrA
LSEGLGIPAIAAKRARYSADPEKRREAARTYRAANPERARDAVLAWQADNPEAVRQIRRNRRARKTGAEGTCNASEAIAIRAAQKDRCAYCNKKLRGGGHFDHIAPLSRGGSNWPNNMQWLCEPCNHSKHDSDPLDFARKKGKLL